jgi:hypothetical protein
MDYYSDPADDQDPDWLDPDLDDIPVGLLIAAATNPSVQLRDPATGQLLGDGTLVLAPGLFGHARRLRDGFYDEPPRDDQPP